MSFRRAKPLADLYAECADYDLVLVPDAPLGDALNRRLERPQFGTFATTPRRFAARRVEQAEDRQAFLRVIERTELSWKQAAYEVGNILQCWEHQGREDAILDYPAYTSATTREVVECLASLDSTSNRLAECSIGDEDVAVVGKQQLTPLERSILPPDVAVIDPFTDDEFDHPPFRIHDSPAAIVEVVMNTVTSASAGDVGVVLESNSEYSRLLESALEAADVPYYGGPGFVDDPDHRAFLQLLRTIHASGETTVGRVRSLLANLGMAVAVDHENKRLADLDHPGSNWLRETREEIAGATFDVAIEAYEEITDRPLRDLRDELDRLGVLDEPVTEPAIDRLAFYLQSYEVPVDRENRGVLLADANSAGYVDRPLVFFLGLDDGWTPTAPQRPWVDEDAAFERNIRQFQSLLQSGTEQHYLVQDASGGTAVTPCLFFEELLDASFERFSDLPSERYARPHPGAGPGSHSTPAAGFERRPVEVGTSEIENISQSSLNSYVNCPRDYFFDRILDGPDADYFVEGNLFHDFAEFYATHPDVVDRDDLDDIADRILAEVAPFLRDVEHGVRRTKYHVGLETIVEYLDANPPTGERILTETDGWGTNFFAEYFDMPIDTQQTEYWFDNDDLGLKGKIDLVQSPTHLLDYKSGSKDSAYTVVKNARFDPPADKPNYQVMVYLAHHRTIAPDESLELTFFHFLETLDELVAGEADMADCLTTVTYYPVTFEAYVAREATFQELQEDAPQDCRDTFSQVDFSAYQSVLEAAELPDSREKDTWFESPFYTALLSEMKDRVGDYKYVETGCDQAIRHLVGLKNENIFREELDDFEAFVEERIAELNRRRAGEERFPIDGPGGEPYYRHVNHRDCLLEGRQS